MVVTFSKCVFYYIEFSTNSATLVAVMACVCCVTDAAQLPAIGAVVSLRVSA